MASVNAYSETFGDISITEFEQIIKYKYKIKKSIEIKYKYSNEGCYNPETEYKDFREDIDTVEKYLLSEIDEKNLKDQ
jgi:hypothetical protein